jgi:predicted amidohydrolase
MLEVALLQISSYGFDQKANMEKGAEFCVQARDMGADIALFPEMWNIGYAQEDADFKNSKIDVRISRAAVFEG